MTGQPDVSLVIPCYNEEKALPITIPPLVRVFRDANVHLELILVANGSKDRTPEIIDEFIAQGFPVVKVTVPVNRGFGFGILSGFREFTGKYVGYLCADGQVRPEDVLMIYRTAAKAQPGTVAKVRRRFRKDSWIRKINSIIYNGLMLLLFPGISTLDVNGNPRVMTAETLRLLDPSSEDWFIDPEIMLKARYLKLPIIEINVPGQLRQAGRSNVKVSTDFEFLKNIWKWKTGKACSAWFKAVKNHPYQLPTTADKVL
jgi:glycosyltransferase involved in cell wall biosynthesis